MADENSRLVGDEPTGGYGDTESAPIEQVAEVEDKTIFRPNPSATVATTAVNVTLNVIGGGLLAIPDALSQTSVIPGIFLLCFMAVVSIFTMICLVLAADKSGRFSYKDILTHCFSSRVGRLFDVILFCYTFGLLIAYTRVIADAMPRVAEDFFKAHGATASSWFWILLSSVVFFGLSSAQQLSGLWWSSYVGFCTICYLGIMVVVRFAGDDYRKPGQGGPISDDLDWFKLTPSFLQAIAVIATSFSCHYNLPAYYGELKARTPLRMLKSLGGFASFTVPFYMIVGLCGLFTFGNAAIAKKKGDIMDNYHRTDVPINVARFGYFIQFLCSFPLVCLACRRALNVVIFNQAQQPRLIAIIEAFILVACSCTLAYFVKSIDTIFSIIGALFGLPIVIVLPPYLYIRVFREAQTVQEAEDAGDDPRRAILNASANDQNHSMAEERNQPGDQEEEEDGDLRRRQDEEDRNLSAVDRKLRLLAMYRSAWMVKVCYVVSIVGIITSATSFVVTVINVAQGKN